MLPNPTTQRRPSEAVVQAEIMAAIGSLPGVVVHRNNVGTALHPDGRRVAYGVGGVGAPDLLCEVEVVGGVWVCLWLEVKTAVGQLGPDQVRWHGAAQRLGRRVAVVRSTSDAVAVIDAERQRVREVLGG